MAEDPKGRPPNDPGQDDPDNLPPKATPSSPTGQDDNGGKPKGQEDRKLEELSEEELEELIRQDEEGVIAELLGPGKFKSWKDLAKGYKELEGTDSRAFNRIKKIADQFNMTPDQMIEHLEKQTADKKPDDKTPAKEPAPSKELQAIKDAQGRQELNRLFDKFQQKMAQEDVDIPDDLKPKLDKLLVAVTVGKSKEQLETLNPYEDAFELHLFRLTKGGKKDVDELKGEIAAFDALKERKKRQLKIPSKPSKRETVTQKQEKEDWGNVDQL